MLCSVHFDTDSSSRRKAAELTNGSRFLSSERVIVPVDFKLLSVSFDYFRNIMDSERRRSSISGPISVEDDVR